MVRAHGSVDEESCLAGGDFPSSVDPAIPPSVPTEHPRDGPRNTEEWRVGRRSSEHLGLRRGGGGRWGQQRGLRARAYVGSRGGKGVQARDLPKSCSTRDSRLGSCRLEGTIAW